MRQLILLLALVALLTGAGGHLVGEMSRAAGLAGVKVVAGNTEIGSGAGPEIFPRAGEMGWKADSAETQVNGLFCPRRCGGGVRRAKCVDPPPAPMQQGRVARLKSAAIPAP